METSTVVGTEDDSNDDNDNIENENDTSTRRNQKKLRICSVNKVPLLLGKLFLVWTCSGSAIVWTILLLDHKYDPSFHLNHSLRRYSSKKPILRFQRRHVSPALSTWNEFLSKQDLDNDDKNRPSPSSPIPWHKHETFQIMHLTDMHLGEAEDTDWGPFQDYQTWRLLDALLSYECPDLIVLGGDQITANNCLHNCTEYYRLLGMYLSQHGIPWATVLGNHDDMAYEVPNNENYTTTTKTIPHSYNRRDLLQIDASFDLSLTQLGPTHVTGAGNYVLQVLDSFQQAPALEIYFLDSGGGTLPEAVDTSQIHWLQQQLSRSTLPAVAFQHIPTSAHEFHDSIAPEATSSSCMGYHGDAVDPIQDSDDLVDALIQSGRFHFLAVGHNHGNDYCCCSHQQYGSNSSNETANNNNNNTHCMYFCFGRHSGYGGYGHWQRGARMYEIQLERPVETATRSREEENVQEKFESSSSNDGSDRFNGGTRWRSWVRLQSGVIIDFFDYDHSP
ncbi:calcineurin-like phosphoesterase [Nitzschia inconspicua]|uniref:Calcineurin-like phosphoesterase n=1 Tax=Nitzschia inconspicua TaxID=303405 RepID=A0A9K3Q5S8_9STRA|nr:calcineurin-like phosphoesterase [Nitzschia inconspicua]